LCLDCSLVGTVLVQILFTNLAILVLHSLYLVAYRNVFLNISSVSSGTQSLFFKGQFLFEQDTSASSHSICHLLLEARVDTL
jgi:hypothetical protein